MQNDLSDKALTELAAIAEGWQGWRSKGGYWNITDPDGHSSSYCHNWMRNELAREPTFYDALDEAGWSPLEDDGDALRLAVKLGMNVWCDPAAVCMAEVLKHCLPRSSELSKPDPYAATRRAIVRAAAAIGQSMKETS